MIKSLKSIVVTLGIIIIILTVIIITTLFKRFNIKQNSNHNINKSSSLSINSSYDIVSTEIEDDLLYVYLKDIEGKDLIKIYDLKTNQILKEINLR